MRSAAVQRTTAAGRAPRRAARKRSALPRPRPAPPCAPLAPRPRPLGLGAATGSTAEGRVRMPRVRVSRKAVPGWASACERNCGARGHMGALCRRCHAPLRGTAAAGAALTGRAVSPPPGDW